MTGPDLADLLTRQEGFYDNVDDVAFLCCHCRRVLPTDQLSDVRTLADRSKNWCDTCAYVTHPDGEGERECDGSCVEAVERGES